MDLEEYPTAELEEELARRKKPPIERLQKLAEPNLRDLELLMNDFVEEIVTEGVHEDAIDDWKENIFEVALMAFYGNDFWSWFRSLPEDDNGRIGGYGT